MKKLFCAVALLATTVSLSSCDSEDVTKEVAQTEDQKTALNVITDLPGTKSISIGPVDLFEDGDQIGLFATTGALGSNYNGFAGYANVNSTRTGGKWIQEPNVYLTGESCTIFAYHPYKKTIVDGSNIAIETTSQTDYMFGTHSNPGTEINSDNPDVYITMKHALALVQFNIFKKNYNSTAKLTKIAIKGGGGFLFKTATMNCQTEKVTVKEEAGAAGVIIQNTVEGLIPSIGSSMENNESLFPRVMSLPVNTTLRDGDLTATFTIDGKDYVYKFAAGTKWDSGKKYTYTITLNGTEIEIGGGDGSGGGSGDGSGNGDVDIDEWTPGTTTGAGDLK